MSTKAKVWSGVAGGLSGLALLIAAVVADTTQIEGGYVNHPADPGGATNHGITERVARANGYTGHMRSLPKGMAEEIYTKDYVQGPGFDRVLEMSPAVGHKLVDAGVNAGPVRSAMWFQTALNHLNQYGRGYPQLVVDGRIGSQTLMAFDALKRTRGSERACEMLLKLIDAQQASHYMRLEKPDFIVGWVDHRVANIPSSRCGETVE